MKRWLKITSLAAGSAFVAMYLAAWLIPLPARLNRPESQIVLDKDGGWMRVQVTPDEGGMVRIPVERDEIPEALVDAVLTFEDDRFYYHPGIDPFALGRAVWLNVTENRVVSGGSTITMQVARMLERRPRTMEAKIIEAFRALQLEARFSKEEILSLYFNFAPYGGNLEGVGSASYYYYGKPVSKLALDEVATLAALPNAPSLLDPRKNKQKLFDRRNDVLERLAKDGKIDEQDALAAMAVPVHAKRQPTPMLAPHAAERARRENGRLLKITTTIDRDLQQQVERLLSDHLAKIGSHGITNGAVVVIENESRKIRAYAGSKQFFDPANQGQVDGAAASRSPGSTLKPFVFALAFDRGLIGEHTLLEDVPLQYKDWAPTNFDGKFRGVISARSALAYSLNIPAVKLAEKLEPKGLIDLLSRAGFKEFQDAPGKYGLATVLGGADVNLTELTNLYATLAQGGVHQNYQLLENQPPQEKQKLFSQGAAYLVTEILTDVRRPDLPEVWREAISIPRIAWKTGTSYGRRDAWSVGYNKRYSVGVWVGNFDGRGVPELVGVESAAPLLFAIAQVLPGATTDSWIERPDTVVTREVCALSGAKPNKHCPHKKAELALADVAPRIACKHHVSIEVDDDSGERLCARCREGHRSHFETHVSWPASVAAYLAASGLPVDPLPAHNPHCSRALAGEGPVIRSPMDGDSYFVRQGIPKEHQQIALVASVESGGGQLFWFVNDALHATVRPGAPVMLDPTPGTHRLTAMDAEGRKSSVTISVR